MGPGMGSGMGGSGMGGSGYGMGGGSGMGGSGYGGDWMEGSGYGGEWQYGGAGECCPTKKIWGSKDWEKDGIYDLVIDGYEMMNMMGSGMGNGGYGMGPGMGYGGYGMGSGIGMGYGGMGMGMNMDDMEWPERCRRHCV